MHVIWCHVRCQELNVCHQESLPVRFNIGKVCWNYFWSSRWSVENMWENKANVKYTIVMLNRKLLDRSMTRLQFISTEEPQPKLSSAFNPPNQWEARCVLWPCFSDKLCLLGINMKMVQYKQVLGLQGHWPQPKSSLSEISHKRPWGQVWSVHLWMYEWSA